LISSLVEDWAPTNTNVQWTRALIGAQCVFEALEQKVDAQNELNGISL
jgi:hypothetical protein